MRMRIGQIAGALLAVACGVLAAVALADPSTQGEVVRVNPDIAGDQGAGGVDMAPDGRFVVSYTEQQQDVGSTAVRAAGGNPVPQVFIRLFAPDGTAGTVVAVNQGLEGRRDASVGVAADGDIVVAYGHDGNGFNEGIRAQRFDAAGTPVGAEIIVSATPARYLPRIAVAPDGRFAIAWQHEPDVEARLYAADGTPVTGVLAVDTSGAARHPDIAMDSQGRFVVVWEESTTLDQPGHVKARRYSALGVPGDQFDAFTGAVNQPYPDPTVGLADDGRFTVFVPGQTTISSGTITGLLGQRADPANAPVGEPFKANATLGTQTFNPAAAMEPDGDLLVAFEESGGGGGNKFYIRQFRPDGSAAGEPVLVGGGGGFNPRARVALDGTGRAALAFTSIDGGGQNQVGAYMRRARLQDVTTTTPTTTTMTTTTTTSPPDTTQTEVVTTKPAAPAKPPASVLAVLPSFAKAVTLPGTKRCVSRRRFRIRVRKLPGGTKIIRAEVLVNNKRVRVVKGARLTAPVDLRALPKGRFTIAIRVTTADGRKISGKRRYRTCTPKRRGSNKSPV